MRACGLYNRGFLIYSTIRGGPCASQSRNFLFGRTIVRDNRRTHVGRTIRIPDSYNNKKGSMCFTSENFLFGRTIVKDNRRTHVGRYNKDS